MGCASSSEVNQSKPLKAIKQPAGKPSDPLTAEGDIIDIIINDPHIEFYQKKLTQAISRKKLE